MTSTFPSVAIIKDLYTRMLLTRIVDDYAWKMHAQGHINFVTSCRGHEGAQVGSAICIEIGKDFTLPYYRDLGVMLTIGMTPYEVFRSYLQNHCPETTREYTAKTPTMPHWGYHKHNIVTVPTSTATQILHAAGIAFACKLRKAPVVTVAYCSDSTTAEADFLEGIRFAAQQQLPVIFICEQDCTPDSATLPNLQSLELPTGLTYQRINGSDSIAVYTAMQLAAHRVRSGEGPMLLEIAVTRLIPHPYTQPTDEENDRPTTDPLICCQQYLSKQGLWDELWASELRIRFDSEVERSMQDALRDALL